MNLFIYSRSLRTISRLHSLSFDAALYGQFSQLLPQLTFIKGNACYACFSPPIDDRRVLCVLLRTLSGRFQRPLRRTPSPLALLRRAPTFQVSAPSSIPFSLRRTAVSPPLSYLSFNRTRVNTPQLEPDEAGPSVSPLSLITGMIHLLHQKKNKSDQ